MTSEDGRCITCRSMSHCCSGTCNPSQRITWRTRIHSSTPSACGVRLPPLARDNRKDVKKVSDNLVGFKLADGYEDFSGGTLTYGASQVMFDVGKALRESE